MDVDGPEELDKRVRKEYVSLTTIIFFENVIATDLDFYFVFDTIVDWILFLINLFECEFREQHQ